MHKRLILLIALGLCLTNTRAEIVSPETAGTLARNFYCATINTFTTEKVSAENLIVKHVFTENRDGENLYYVFDVIDGGFVIVSAEDAIMPVLGYSLEANFVAKNQPPAFRHWMNDYCEQIQWIRRHNLNSNEKAAAEWKRYLNGIPSAKSEAKAVSPMLFTKWNQGKFFNEYCPDDPAGPDGHAYAGCVPTAVAQIMNYYRWPEHGTGTYSYVHPVYDTISADFENTWYRWNEMPLNLLSYNDAIAELLFHPGVAVDLNYGPNGSGMYNHKAAYALRTNFGYSPLTEYIFRDTTTLNWKAIILTHLDNNMPLYYAGWADTINESGHAFVCDGYQDTTYFHFNWGWGGSLDGYFMIDQLTPGGSDFTLDHELIVNIFPDGAYPYYCNGLDTITQMSATVEDGSGPVNDYMNNADCFWLIAPDDSVNSIKIQFLKFNLPDPDDHLIIYNGDDTGDPIVGNYTGSTLPSLLTVSGQKVLIHFMSDDSIAGSGWLLSYTTIIPVYCTGIQTVTASTGHIEDGSGPREYHSNSNCRWKIQPPGETDLTIHMNSVGIGPGDFFMVFNQINGDTLCFLTSDSLPPDIQCPGASVLVYFKSDGKDNGEGFDLDYYVTTGIDVPDDLQQMILFPNPAASAFTLSGNFSQERTVSIELCNYLMDRLEYREYKQGPGTFKWDFDASTRAPGLYFLKIKNGDAMLIKKLILTH